MMYGERSLENLQLPNEWVIDPVSAAEDYFWDFVIKHTRSSRYIIHTKKNQWRVLYNVWVGKGQNFDNLEEAITFCLLVQTTERNTK